MVSVVDFGTVGYNETETDNTTAFSHAALPRSRCRARAVRRARRGRATEHVGGARRPCFFFRSRVLVPPWVPRCAYVRDLRVYYNCVS